MPYSFHSHTADLRMSVSGKTLENLFKDALFGMVEASQPAKQQPAQAVTRTIELKALDKTALLIDFLSKTLALMQTEYEAYTNINFEIFTEHSLKAKLVGYKIESFGKDIKAVTYHEADVKKNNYGDWQTMIIFDI